MRKTFLFLTVVAMATAADAREYAVGQLWSYQSRPGDESSVVLINLIEVVPKLGTIYHISVLRVHMPSLRDDSRSLTDLPHLPVSKETLDKSVVALVGSREPFSPYREGYAEWKSAFDAGQAGVFTISVADVIAIIERQLGAIGSKRRSPREATSQPEMYVTLLGHPPQTCRSCDRRLTCDLCYSDHSENLVESFPAQV